MYPKFVWRNKDCISIEQIVNDRSGGKVKFLHIYSVGSLFTSKKCRLITSCKNSINAYQI